MVVGICGTLPLLYDPDELNATTVTGTMVPGLGPPIYMAAFACLVSQAWSGRRTTTKTRPLLFLLPFCFSAALGTIYQIASQAENCAPFKLTACAAPNWLATPTCAAYSTYYKCVRASGCWGDVDKQQCLWAAGNVTLAGKLGVCNLGQVGCMQPPVCNLDCAVKSRYSTVVDLSGFNVGEGSYKNLFGVNIVSAVGALCMFLFAASDDLLEKRLEAAKAKTDASNALEMAL